MPLSPVVIKPDSDCSTTHRTSWWPLSWSELVGGSFHSASGIGWFVAPGLLPSEWVQLEKMIHIFRAGTFTIGDMLIIANHENVRGKTMYINHYSTRHMCTSNWSLTPKITSEKRTTGQFCLTEFDVDPRYLYCSIHSTVHIFLHALASKYLSFNRCQCDAVTSPPVTILSHFLFCIFSYPDWAFFSKTTVQRNSNWASAFLIAGFAGFLTVPWKRDWLG